MVVREGSTRQDGANWIPDLPMRQRFKRLPAPKLFSEPARQLPAAKDEERTFQSAQASS